MKVDGISQCTDSGRVNMFGALTGVFPKESCKPFPPPRTLFKSSLNMPSARSNRMTWVDLASGLELLASTWGAPSRAMPLLGASRGSILPKTKYFTCVGRCVSWSVVALQK